jgi:hypothetical protein
MIVIHQLINASDQTIFSDQYLICYVGRYTTSDKYLISKFNLITGRIRFIVLEINPLLNGTFITNLYYMWPSNFYRARQQTASVHSQTLVVPLIHFHLPDIK